MITLHHPTLPDVSVQVEDSRSAEWLEAGWKRPEAADREPTKQRRAAATKE